MNKLCFLILLVMPFVLCAQHEPIKVGAKHFNEGYILSEMISQILEDGGFEVERKFNLGGTAVSFEALHNKAIDVYPEYTGTIASEILKQKTVLTLHEIQLKIKEQFNLEISESYGFNNTYALVMSSALAEELHIATISDLSKYATLRIGLSYEFTKRNDGWEHLALFYTLPHVPIAIEHGLAYQAMLNSKIDVTDAYSTDGEIHQYQLQLLNDNKKFFPEYQAVSFYHASLPEKAKELLNKLTSLITEAEMQTLNASALNKNSNHRDIARDFLINKGLIKASSDHTTTDLGQILSKTVTHLKLTFIALIIAILFAVPLGVIIYRHHIVSQIVLYVVGIMQTIPSIALLALMIPVLGIGVLPAVVALFLYALLPILRNTIVGLLTVDPSLKKVATAIGLNNLNKLRYVEFPLAIPVILTGIRTAAVINVGTATLAAFIGAGGLGEFIVTGLALNNTKLILMGAIPAAVVAILMELGFEAMEKIFIPRHLR